MLFQFKLKSWKDSRKIIRDHLVKTQKIATEPKTFFMMKNKRKMEVKPQSATNVKPFHAKAVTQSPNQH